MIITGLRLTQGLDTDHLKNHTGLALAELLDPVKTQQLIKAGLLFWKGSFLALTERGIACLNTIITTLLVPE